MSDRFPMEVMLRRVASGIRDVDVPIDREATADFLDRASAEIVTLRAQLADLTSIAGVAAVGKSFAEIAKDLPRRSGESD